MKEIPITHKTERLLRYILRHQNISFGALCEKFPELDYMDLVLLCVGEYLVCQKQNGRPTMFANEPFTVESKDTFWASPKAEQFIEERFQRRWQWFIPTTISALALIVSTLAFIWSIWQI